MRPSKALLPVGFFLTLAGSGWVWLFRYEVRAFFTGQDPLDIILFLPVLWIPGALLALGGFCMLCIGVSEVFRSG